MTKKCALCNKQIIGRKKKAIYCSTQCCQRSFLAKNKQRLREQQRIRYKKLQISKTRTCKMCDEVIFKKSQYCSTNCSNKNYRSKNKERDRIYQKQYQREARKKSKLLERPTPERGKHKMPKEPADFSKFDDLYDELGMGNVKKD